MTASRVLLDARGPGEPRLDPARDTPKTKTRRMPACLARR